MPATATENYRLSALRNHRSGSTLFFVWQQGRELSSDQPTDFNFRHDLSNMFNLHPNNTLLIKASYWFNP